MKGKAERILGSAQVAEGGEWASKAVEPFSCIFWVLS
jgi:hypothetical protein